MSYPNEILRPENLSPEERERVLSVLDTSPEVVDDERLSYAYRPTVPLIDIVSPSVSRNERRLIIPLCIIAGIVGLILGWITAPFGLVPT